LKRVLLIEDNDDDRDIFFTSIKRRGYDVLEAADGPSGLIQAIEMNPDLVVLDLKLPGMSGWEIANVLTTLEQCANIKVLVVSAFKERRQDSERSIEHKVHGYLLKPIEPRELVEEIYRLIGPP
jgi:two-component system, cell cycle response regulator DivK